MAENIFLFYPNIIGYVRIAFTFLSCYYWFTHPLTSAFFFVMSQTFLDDLDGIAARRFNQATLFGGTLDIVIDRCSFMVYLMGLCVLYPNYMILFQFVGFLDISRMWMKMYSAAVTGNYFKKVDNAILKFYYSELGLHIFSFGSELFFVAIYLLYFSTGPSGSYTIGLWHVLAAITLPIVIIKQPLNMLILKIGCQDIVAVDYARRAEQSN